MKYWSCAKRLPYATAGEEEPEKLKNRLKVLLYSMGMLNVLIPSTVGYSHYFFNPS